MTLVSYKMFAILSKKKLFAIGTSPFAEKKQNVCDQENLVLARKKSSSGKRRKIAKKLITELFRCHVTATEVIQS